MIRSYFNLWSSDWLLAAVCLQATDAVMLFASRARVAVRDSQPPHHQQRVGAVSSLRPAWGKGGFYFTDQTNVAGIPPFKLHSQLSIIYL